MNKQMPDIGGYLSEQALREYYKPKRQHAEMAQLEQFCFSRENRGIPHIYRTFLMLQRNHIDRIIVGIIIQSLSEEERHFVRYRYKNNQQIEWIAQKLHVSKAVVGRMNRRILREICTLLFYKLSEDDIFHRLKVLNMVHIMDLRIKAMIQCEHDFVDRDWLNGLIYRRGRYRKLLDIMQECTIFKDVNDEFGLLDAPACGETLTDDELAFVDALKNKVVATKLSYPHCNVSEISRISGISKPTVSRKLHQYMAKAYQFLC